MCAEQALASWGDLQPLRSKMSQKPRSTAVKSNGTRVKVSEARRKSTHEGSGASKPRSVSRDNKAPSRRESVKPPAQQESKRSSSQHESRKVSVPQESKKPTGQREVKPTARQADGKKPSSHLDRKAASSRHESKPVGANPKADISRTTGEVPKNKDSLKTQLPTASLRSQSRHAKDGESSSNRRHSRGNEKERGLEKVSVTSSSSGASEKRTKETLRAATVSKHATDADAKAKHGGRVESKGAPSASSPKSHSSLITRPEKLDVRHKDQSSPYAKPGTSRKVPKKTRPREEAASEANEEAQTRTSTATGSKKSRTVSRQETYSADQMQQANSKEAAVEVAEKAEQASVTNMLSTTPGTVEEAVCEASTSGTSKSKHPSVADDSYNYDDDFEEYESDFEAEDALDEESSSTSTSSSEGAEGRGSGIGSSQKVAVEAVNKESASASKYSESNAEKLKEQSHWKSEPALEVEAKPPAPLMPTSFSTYSLVGYLTAQKKEESKKVLSKAQQRAKDVLEMVSLDSMTFQVFDIPPTTYDVYITTFGRADAKQVLVQTDLGDDEECQTETIELKEKWTQHPPHDYKGFGGSTNETSPDSKAQHLQSGEDVMDLFDFLKNSSDLMLRVIEEDLACKTRRNRKQASEVNGFSGGFLRLDPLPFARRSRISFVCFSRLCPNYLATGHDLSSLQPEDASAVIPGDTIICTWNLNNPTKPTDILVSHNQVTCCYWSPLDAVSLATGSLDGSIELWDLREKFCLSKAVVINNEELSSCEEYSMKMPAYSTASLFESECHFAKVVDIRCWTQDEVHGSSESAKQHRVSPGSSPEGYHVWSLDEEGTLVSWAVTEAQSEPGGSLTDLGLAPGARLRLIRASAFRVADFFPPSYDEETRDGLKTFGMAQLDATRVLVATDIGMILHLDLYKAKTSPKVFKPKHKSLVAQECWISLSPHHPSFFLVASQNGALRLHFLEYEQAVWEWDPLEKTELGAILWSPASPARFYAAMASGEVAAWDLSAGHAAGPPAVFRFPSSRVLVTDANHTSASRTFEPCLALAMDDGTVQVHLMDSRDESHHLDRDQIQKMLLSL
ncbi:cytoplasmic dynein 2 intermediate chain 1 [Amblyomma americanum]